MDVRPGEPGNFAGLLPLFDRMVIDRAAVAPLDRTGSTVARLLELARSTQTQAASEQRDPPGLRAAG